MLYSSASKELLYRLVPSRQLSSILNPLRGLARRLSHQAASLDAVVSLEPDVPAPVPVFAEPLIDYPLLPDPYEQHELWQPHFSSTPSFVLIEPHQPEPLLGSPLPQLTPADEISAAIEQARGIAFPDDPLPGPNLEQRLDEPFPDPLFPPLFGPLM